MKKVSVVIINYNTPEMTERAVMAMHKAEPLLDFGIVLVDNGSDKKPEMDKLGMYVTKYIACRKNHGFAGGAVKGIEALKSEYILLLNSDALVSEKAITRMVKYMELEPRTGIIGARLDYTSGNTQASFGRFPTLGRELMRFSMLSKILPGGSLVFKNIFTKEYFNRPVEVDWVSGGCMLIRRSMLDEIGGIDKNYFFGAEDIDLCYRARQAGWQVVYHPQSRVIHYHGFSSGGRRSTASLRLEAKGMDYFFKKHLSKKLTTRLAVKFMYWLKAAILDMLFKSSETGGMFKNLKHKRLGVVSQ